MSTQVDKALQIPGSYNFHNDRNSTYRSKSIESNGFTAWAANNMYKSSYSHFHSKDSTEPKSTAIPGYQGFIPKVNSQSLHAKRFSSLTKDVLGKSNYGGLNITGLSTNGFNVTSKSFVDNSKIGSTSKYGRSGIVKPHPAWQPLEWKTTTQDTYRSPRELGDPLHRSSQKNAEYRKKPALSSGFSTNRDYWDGTGWNPEKVLKASNVASEYRNIYNPERQFHRDANISKARKLQRPEQNYKFNL